MNLENSFVRLSPYFYYWSKIIERQARELEIADSSYKDLNRLLISPPTDFGMKLLSQRNVKDVLNILCFSSTTENIAKKYLERHQLQNIKIAVSEFFQIPFEDSSFDVIYANCVFDFCQDKFFDIMIAEIKRALKKGGKLFAVYMDQPKNFRTKIWKNFMDIFPFISQNCHPVDIIPTLLNHKFKLKKEISLQKLWFPIKYVVAEK